jgi:hypothetical protein
MTPTFPCVALFSLSVETQSPHTSSICGVLGQRYALWEEAAAFAKPLYVLDGTEGGPRAHAVQRRVTVVRDRGGEQDAAPVLESIPLGGTEAGGEAEAVLEAGDIVEIPVRYLT